MQNGHTPNVIHVRADGRQVHPLPQTPLAHGHMWEQHVLGDGTIGWIQVPAQGVQPQQQVGQAPQQQMQSADPGLMAAHRRGGQPDPTVFTQSIQQVGQIRGDRFPIPLPGVPNHVATTPSHVGGAAVPLIPEVNGRSQKMGGVGGDARPLTAPDGRAILDAAPAVTPAPVDLRYQHPDGTPKFLNPDGTAWWPQPVQGPAGYGPVPIAPQAAIPMPQSSVLPIHALPAPPFELRPAR